MYNKLVMTIQDWAGLIVAILTIISSVALSIKWLVKHYLSELKPNSGSSLKDEVRVIKERQNDSDEYLYKMDSKIDQMYMVLLDHVSKHND